MAAAYCELCGVTSRDLVLCADCGRKTCRRCLDDDYENVCLECGPGAFRSNGASGGFVDPLDDVDVLDDDDDLFDSIDDDSLDEDEVSNMIRNGGGIIRPTGRA